MPKNCKVSCFYFLIVETTVPAKKELHWEGDMQLHSHYLDRKVLIFSTHENRKLISL